MIKYSVSLLLLLICPVYLLPFGRIFHSLVDLSYPYDDKVTYFPGYKPFRLEVALPGQPKPSDWIAANTFCGPEHGGTHMDAPYHFYKHGWKLDEIPFERFVAPAVVVDISFKVSPNNRNAELEVKDLLKWESKYGRIPEASVILLYSGHGRNWGNATAFLGVDTLPPKGISILDTVGQVQMNFPGFGEKAAEWLVKNRNIVGIGTDALTLDVGNSTTYPAHKVFLRNNIYALENVANIEKLPPCGATLYSLPMKIKGGTGAPARILAHIS